MVSLPALAEGSVSYLNDVLPLIKCQVPCDCVPSRSILPSENIIQSFIISSRTKLLT
jgi:hypothetical protein